MKICVIGIKHIPCYDRYMVEVVVFGCGYTSDIVAELESLFVSLA